jgi:hypothetical protein
VTPNRKTIATHFWSRFSVVFRVRTRRAVKAKALAARTFTNFCLQASETETKKEPRRQNPKANAPERWSRIYSGSGAHAIRHFPDERQCCM